MGILIDYFKRVAMYDWWVIAIVLLLIGLVVYWVVECLEGTRGERLFRGVIFILLAERTPDPYRKAEIIYRLLELIY